MEDMVDFAKTRILLVRLGELSIQCEHSRGIDEEYDQAMRTMIEEDHIWDWHFFLEKQRRQAVYFLNDFFEDDDVGNLVRPYRVNDANSTTQLGYLDHGRFRNDEQAKKLFREMGLADESDLAFDDITIYGSIRGLERYPRFDKMCRDSIGKVEINQIHIFYSGRPSLVRRIVLDKQAHGVALLELISRLYNKDHFLYIDQPEHVFEQDRVSAEAMAKYIVDKNSRQRG
jgi:hypothetical protein